MVQWAWLGNCQAAELDGPVALAECRSGVVVCIFARECVRGAGMQMQLQLALLRFRNNNRALRQRQLRAALRGGLREKNAMPLRPRGGHIVNVENQPREALVEHAWLQRKWHLRGDKIRPQRSESPHCHRTHTTR